MVFLPVGHTHEKVDRTLFAPIGNTKKVTKCKTMDNFPVFAKQGFTGPQPKFQRTVFVWDWKEWLEPHIRSIERFKDFCTFKFTLNDRLDPVVDSRHC